jgi:hypothetical protein
VAAAFGKEQELKREREGGKMRTGLEHVGDDHGSIEANVRVRRQADLRAAQYVQHVVSRELVGPFDCGKNWSALGVSTAHVLLLT